MNFLTQAEEQIMLKLWELKKASVKEVLEQYENPKPAYNTVSTIIRILEKKDMVKHKKKKKGFVYEPKISREEYLEFFLNHLTKNYGASKLEDVYSKMIQKRTVEHLF